jgi:tRNA dimethylallyltransferase
MLPRILLTGPTASGKGEVAHQLARRIGGEVALMDSMKIYRGMDIGTAKPSGGRRAEVAYHLLDLVDPWEDFSVGDYLGRALQAVEEIEARGRPVVFSGGTALYLLALVEGLFSGPQADWELRRSLAEEARVSGLEPLHRRLEEEDPAAAAKIHPHDARRIIRALEVRSLTGRAMTELWGGPSRRLAPGSFRIFGIQRERPQLYRRIDRRVLDMAARGLFEEARALRDRPPGMGRAAAQCIGYREIFEGDERGASREETIAEIQMRTRRFAKQQMTWFRRFAIHWFTAGEETEASQVVDWILGTLPPSSNPNPNPS